MSDIPSVQPTNEIKESIEKKDENNEDIKEDIKEIEKKEETNQNQNENENNQSIPTTLPEETIPIQTTNEPKEEENHQEIIEVNKKQSISLIQKGEKMMITIVLVIREKIQQSIDLSFRLLSIPIDQFKKIMSKPIPRRIITGGASLAVVGVCIYAFGYIPYQHVTQSKQLKFH